jgi:hypothetical protein
MPIRTEKLNRVQRSYKLANGWERPRREISPVVHEALRLARKISCLPIGVFLLLSGASSSAICLTIQQNG